MTRKWQSLLDTIRSVKSLPCSTPWPTLHFPYPRKLRVMDESRSSPHTPSISPMPQTSEKSSYLEGRTVILPASFYGSNVTDITRNRQVIQVYSSLVRSSDLKMSTAHQTNNLLTTMIIDDPTTNYYRSVEDICIPMITRFSLLMFLFRDIKGNIMRLNGKFVLQFTLMADLRSSLPSHSFA